MKDALSVITMVALASLTFLRAQTWASESNLYDFMYKAHPQSPRVTAIMAEKLTVQGRYEYALQVLASATGNGAALQRLYIRCRRDGTLNEKNIDQLRKGLESPIEDYAATGLIELARLGLENECLFSKENYALLLEKASDTTISATHSRQKILLYKAHYHWELGQVEAAIATLDKSYGVTADNPIPLFLATEWLLEMGDNRRATSYFSKAKTVAKTSHPFYDKFIRDIGGKLRK